MGDWYKELKKLDGQQCLTLTQNRPATMCVSDGGVTIKYRSERTLLIGWALLARAYHMLLDKGTLDSDDVSRCVCDRDCCDRLLAILRELPEVEVVRKRDPRTLALRRPLP